MDIKRYAGNCGMDDFSIVIMMNGDANITRTMDKAPEITLRLANQLNWLRSNIDSFR